MKLRVKASGWREMEVALHLSILSAIMSRASEIKTEIGSPKSVIGIGNKGMTFVFVLEACMMNSYFQVAKPDYSEAKIVLAMV